MKLSLALSLLGGILIGIITTGVIVLARDDFYWYRNAKSETNLTATQKTSSLDALFIENMIPHHEHAIEMANLALTQAKTEEVKNLSKNIITTQQKEIDDMTTWYKTWFGAEVKTASASWSGGMMGNGRMMGGGESSENLNELANASDFDKAFVAEMIPHHEMAIMMAQMLLQATTRNEMKTLAQNSIDTQTLETEQMYSWIEKWE